MLTRKSYIYAIGALTFLAGSIASAEKMKNLIIEGNGLGAMSYIHVVLASLTAIMMYLIARDTMKGRTFPIGGKKRKMTVLGLGAIIFALFCGGCATDLITYIEQGAPHIGNDIFHSVTGAICVAIIIEFIRNIR